MTPLHPSLSVGTGKLFFEFYRVMSALKRIQKTHLFWLLLNAYKMYCRPILEYASIIWSPFSKVSKFRSLIDQIERVQRLFTRRLITRCVGKLFFEFFRIMSALKRMQKTHLFWLLLNAYKIYCRPILKYASIIWSPFSKVSKFRSLIDQIERVQRLFTRRLITRCVGYTNSSNINYKSYIERLVYFKLESLELRR